MRILVAPTFECSLKKLHSQQKVSLDKGARLIRASWDLDGKIFSYILCLKVVVLGVTHL